MPGGFRGEDEVVIDAAPVQVWQALLDPERLRAVIPGCESVEATGPDSYRARVRISVAGIGGTLRRRDAAVRPPRARAHAAFRPCRKSPWVRRGRGDRQRSLRLPEGRTRLAYRYVAAVGGKLAGFGHRMLDGVVRVLLASFFERLGAHLRGEHTGGSGVDQTATGMGSPCCGCWLAEADGARMKPASFSYLRPDSANDACRALAQYGEEARIIAGGQSLGAMLNMRLVTPSVLIDVNRLDALATIEDDGEIDRDGRAGTAGRRAGQTRTSTAACRCWRWRCRMSAIIRRATAARSAARSRMPIRAPRCRSCWRPSAARSS